MRNNSKSSKKTTLLVPEWNSTKISGEKLYENAVDEFIRKPGVNPDRFPEKSLELFNKIIPE